MCLALVYKLGWLQVSSKPFAVYFFKGTHLGICKNGIFCTWARLFVFLASYLGKYYNSSLKISSVKITIITKHSILDVAATLDPLLILKLFLQICPKLTLENNKKKKFV